MVKIELTDAACVNDLVWLIDVNLTGALMVNGPLMMNGALMVNRNGKLTVRQNPCKALAYAVPLAWAVRPCSEFVNATA